MKRTAGVQRSQRCMRCRTVNVDVTDKEPLVAPSAPEDHPDRLFRHACRVEGGQLPAVAAGDADDIAVVGSSLGERPLRDLLLWCRSGAGERPCHVSGRRRPVWERRGREGRRGGSDLRSRRDVVVGGFPEGGQFERRGAAFGVVTPDRHRRPARRAAQLDVDPPDSHPGRVQQHRCRALPAGDVGQPTGPALPSLHPLRIGRCDISVRRRWTHRSGLRRMTYAWALGVSRCTQGGLDERRSRSPIPG